MQEKICSKWKCRFGLCCIFVKEEINFRTLYARNLESLGSKERLKKISEVCLSNAKNLLRALQKVREFSIGAFRINSKFFPLYTHPEMRYTIDDLPDAEELNKLLSEAKDFAKKNDIRLSFHPDQFVILSAERENVVRNSIEELEYHGLISDLVGAEVINIHLGGKYDSKEKAKERFIKNFAKLSKGVKERLTIENDDIIYTVRDIKEVSDAIKIPFVYDIHHHRCNADCFSEAEATDLCIRSWKSYRPEQEPYFHISSSRTAGSRDHADYLDVRDFPRMWLKVKATIDIEAKAKELAILKLMKELSFK